MQLVKFNSKYLNNYNSTILKYHFNNYYLKNRELQSYFGQMCRYIDITKDEYYKEIKKYENDIKILQIVSNQSKVLRYIYIFSYCKLYFYIFLSNNYNNRNKGKYIHEDFEKFSAEYLKIN